MDEVAHSAVATATRTSPFTFAPGPRDARLYLAAGAISLLGALGIGLGAVLPWASYRAHTMLGSVHTVSIGAGDLSQQSWFQPLLIATACALALAGAYTIVHPSRPNLVMPLLPTFVTIGAVAEIWNVMFPGPKFGIGLGCALCVVGMALGVVATLLMLRVEHPVTR